MVRAVRDRLGRNYPLIFRVNVVEHVEGGQTLLDGLPVIGVGKLGNAMAAKSVEGSFMDLVAIGRQMIADPDSAGKVLAGKEGEIIPCKECMACFASLRKGPVICKVNRNLPWSWYQIPGSRS